LRPWRRARLSGELEPDVLLALEKRLASESIDIFKARGEGQEVVAREGPGLRGEAHIAVGQQQLRLADAARVEDDLARRRIAGVVLKRDPEIQVAERHPHALAAPANVNDLADKRHMLDEGRHRFWRGLVLEITAKRIRPGNDFDFVHAALLSAGGLRPDPESRRSSVFSLDVQTPSRPTSAVCG